MHWKVICWNKYLILSDFSSNIKIRKVQEKYLNIIIVTYDEENILSGRSFDIDYSYEISFVMKIYPKTTWFCN